MTTPLDRDIVEWIEAVTGAAEVFAERRSAGASREGWAIDVTHRDGTVDALWLKIDTGHGPLSGTSYSLHREATVYRALEHTPVRVPHVLGTPPAREAFLAARLEGANWFSEIADAEEQVRIADDYMSQLAELHRLDPRQLDLPGFDTHVTMADALRSELDTWQRQLRTSNAGPEPIVVLALRWLRRHMPTDGNVVLVHGDAGPGNFMYADGRVLALVDWEVAHLGDRHDDLGWVCVRDLQERFGSLPDRFRTYEQAAGSPIDLDRLRYFRVLAQTRCAIGTLRGLAERHVNGEIANHLIYSTLHTRVLVEALADVLGVELEPHRLDDPGPTADTGLFDVALADLQNSILPASNSDFARRRTKGLARLLKYLRERDRLGAAADAAELADLQRVLHADVPDVAAGRRALCAAIDDATVADEAVLRLAGRRMSRTTQIMSPAMGALADRHYAPVS